MPANCRSCATPGRAGMLHRTGRYSMARREEHDGGKASRRYHDRVAGRYDDSYRTAHWDYSDKLVWEFIKPLLPADRPARALDLGCGTGKWGQKLAKSGFAVTFVDHSVKMVDKARQRASELNLKQCEFLTADICDLAALPDASCHFAVALGDPFCLCSSADAAARELARLLAPGGRAVVSFDHRYGALEHFFTEGDVEALERFVRDGKTHWLTDDKAEQFPVTMFTADGISALWQRAGLEQADLIGLTVLPVRRFPQLLRDETQRERLLALEKKLQRQRDLWARATHLLAAVRKPA